MVRNRNSDYLTLYKINKGICVEIRQEPHRNSERGEWLRCSEIEQSEVELSTQH